MSIITLDDYTISKLADAIVTRLNARVSAVYSSTDLPPDAPVKSTFHRIAKRVPGATKRGRSWVVSVSDWNRFRDSQTSALSGGATGAASTIDDELAARERRARRALGLPPIAPVDETERTMREYVAVTLYAGGRPKPVIPADASDWFRQRIEAVEVELARKAKRKREIEAEKAAKLARKTARAAKAR